MLEQLEDRTTPSTLATETYLSSGADPSTVGQSVTLTALVDNGHTGVTVTGTVEFDDGATVLATVPVTPGLMGQATLTTSALAPGDHLITAAYSGDANLAASTSAALDQSVQPLPTATSGPSGASGPSITTGPTATSGPTSTGGPTGVTGPSGPTSTSGPTYVSGPSGPGAPTSTSGPSGPTGATGPTSMSGPSGPTSTGGPSASTGPTATGAPSGPTSTGGPSGASGASGPTSTGGPSGPTSATSPTSMSGPSGPTYTGAPSGMTGPTSVSGPTYVSGPSGASGPTSTGGPTGMTGPTSVSGPSGPTGVTGPSGPTVMTVSFVPDGTQIGSEQSQFFADVGADAASWEELIFSELQSVASQQGITLQLVPDDGASLNMAAPQDGQIRIAAVDQAFLGGTPAYALPNGGYLVAEGSLATFEMGLSLVGPGGPLSPVPVLPPGVTAPNGPASATLPLILPFQPAAGNVYSTGPSGPSSGPTGTTEPSGPDGGLTGTTGPSGAASGPSGPTGTDGSTTVVEGIDPILLSAEPPPPDAPPSSTGPTAPSFDISSSAVGGVKTWLITKLSPLLTTLAPSGTLQVTVSSVQFDTSNLSIIPISLNQPPNPSADAGNLLKLLNAAGGLATSKATLNLKGANSGAPLVSGSTDGDVTIPVVIPLVAIPPAKNDQWPPDLILTTCTFHYEIQFSLQTLVPQAFANPVAAILKAITGSAPMKP